jgi:hypothetical protein
MLVGPSVKLKCEKYVKQIGKSLVWLYHERLCTHHPTPVPPWASQPLPTPHHPFDADWTRCGLEPRKVSKTNLEEEHLLLLAQEEYLLPFRDNRTTAA